MLPSIRDYRQRKGWSCRDLAKAAGISYNTVLRLEHLVSTNKKQGIKFMPQTKVVNRISNALAVPVHLINEFMMVGNVPQAEPETEELGEKQLDPGIELARAVAFAAMVTDHDQMLELLDQAIATNNYDQARAIALVASERNWHDLAQRYLVLTKK